MSEHIHHAAVSAGTDSKLSAGVKRAHAVAIALELVVARSEAGGGSLTQEMDRLSGYADKIQAALEVK